MLINFFYTLRAAKLPVSVPEYLTLLQALKAGVIGPSVDDFYVLSRTILVKDYKLDVDQVSLDTPLESLGIDSLGVADMLFNLEDEFLIVLPPEQVDLPTIGDVVHFIDGLIAAQSGRMPQSGTRVTTLAVEAPQPT